MKRFVCLSNVIIALGFLTIVSCESIFIFDPIDPRLPKYTENGNNAAGAFMNKDVWKSVEKYSFLSVSNEPYLTVFTKHDSLILNFSGDILKEKNVFLSTKINFYLKGLNIHNFSDLSTLKNKTIQLDGVNCYGAFVTDYYSTNYPGCSGTAGIGQIYFRNVAIDDLNQSVTLSGTFGFTLPNSYCGSVEVSYGRFDYIFTNNSNLDITSVP